jgi:hypothetical protein
MSLIQRLSRYGVQPILLNGITHILYFNEEHCLVSSHYQHVSIYKIMKVKSNVGVEVVNNVFRLYSPTEWGDLRFLSLCSICFTFQWEQSTFPKGGSDVHGPSNDRISKLWSLTLGPSLPPYFLSDALQCFDSQGQQMWTAIDIL